mgnify:CR=1 FL=1
MYERNWQAVGEPVSGDEAEALDVLRGLLRDDELCHAWSNLAFQDRTGHVNEVDVLLLTRRGLFVVELKGWRGHVPGQYIRIGVDIDGVRHWRAYSLTSRTNPADGLITITTKAIPEGSLVMGAPGKVVREISDAQARMLVGGSMHYVENWKRYARGLKAI